MAHRAIICAALSKGASSIDNIVLSDDVTATLGAIRALGADAAIYDSPRFKGRKRIEVKSSGSVRIKKK
jgi:3-phosphoshikimate 1-carboxyvinyltransferase